jgi:hypothetical protein
VKISNKMAFQYRTDPLSIEEAFIHLKHFDLNDKIHVDMIEKPEGGQLYMFYSDDENKLRKF